MTKVPSLNYNKVIKALERDGWVIVLQKGFHIRLQKNVGNEVLKLIVSAHQAYKKVNTITYIKTSKNINR